MDSNRSACSLCHTVNPPKLFFLPCLNIFCNKCVACLISQQSTDFQNNPIARKLPITIQSTEFDNNTGLNESKDFDINDRENWYSLAKDDGNYEIISLENSLCLPNEGNSGGYEVPNIHTLYQNSKFSQGMNEFQHTDDHGFYEAIASKSTNKNVIKSDDEVFEEIQAKESNIKHSRYIRNTFPPKPSIHRKSVTLPDCRSNDIGKQTVLNNSILVENELLIKDEHDEVVGVQVDNTIHFKCPSCRDHHWISEQGDLVVPFPSFPRYLNNISIDEAKSFVELLSSHPGVCSSKLCLNPCKNMHCTTCGKVVCEHCISAHHSRHYASNLDSLNARYRTLVEYYVSVSEERRHTCATEAKRLENDMDSLVKIKAEVITNLTRQKKLLMMEVDKIFKEKINSLEKNFGLEMFQLESSLSLINRQILKMDRFSNFANAFLREDCKVYYKMEIFSSIINSFPGLVAFTPPQTKPLIQICSKQADLDVSILSSMLGDFYFKRKSLGETVSVQQVPAKIKDQQFQVPLQLSPKVSLKSRNKTLKAGGNRLSRIFKRSECPSKSEVDQSQIEDVHVPLVAPSANFNMQLTSDNEECRLVDFSVAGGHHIVALDTNNQCLKILNLISDTLRVVPLKINATSALRVAALESNGDLMFTIAKCGSNCVRLYDDSGREIGSIGSNYLLNISSVAANSHKQILASDVVHKKIFAYDYRGKFLFSFPRGMKHGKQKSPHDFIPVEIKINPSNNDVIVLDDARKMFLVFDKVGTYLYNLPGGDDSAQAWNNEDSCRMKSNRCPTCIQRNNMSIAFDEEGCIYRRSNSGCILFVHNCNGRFIHKIDLHIEHFESYWLISILECPIRRSASGEDSNASGSSEKSVVLTLNFSSITLYRLHVPSISLESGECTNSSMEEEAKKAIDPIHREVKLEIIESRYADMSGKRREDDEDHHQDHHNSEYVYTTIEDDPTPYGDSTNNEIKSRRRRFSARFKKMFTGGRKCDDLSRNEIKT